MPNPASHIQQLRFQQSIRQNGQDIYVMSAPELVALWLEKQRPRGLSREQAEAALEEKMEGYDLQNLWQVLRKPAEFASSYGASAVDVALLSKLGRDLQRGGSLLTKYRIQRYQGKDYIIFKGNHRLRTLLRGTRYLANSQKVVEMGIGKVGVAHAVTQGMRLTLFLSVGFRSIDTLLQDESTWHYFVGHLATDIVKLAASGAAALIGSAFASAGATVGTLAIGPLFVAIVAAVAVSVFLNDIDEQYGLSRRVVIALKDIEKDMLRDLRRVKQDFVWHHRSTETSISFWRHVFGAY